MSQDEHAAQIAEFICTKGVTRCPTACALPTQGTVSAADRVALERYWIAREKQRKKGPAARREAPPLSLRQGLLA